MRVLLGLGEAVVAHAHRGEDFGEDVLVPELREGDGQGERVVVEREADEVNLGSVGRGELFKAGDGQRPRDLARAVGAEVEEDAGVAVFDCGYGLRVGARDDGWLDELVRRAALVGAPDRLDRLGGALTLGVDEQAIGALGSLPAPVPVHRVVTPADRGDLAERHLGDLVLERFDVKVSGRGRRVAPVEEAVDVCAPDAALLRHPQKGVEVFL